MVLTILKTNFRKLEPKIVRYRNCNNFSNKLFRENLVIKLSVTETNANGRSFDKFLKLCGEVLNRHGPPKKKYILGNQSRLMNKTLSKEGMKRARLRNNFLENRIEENPKKKCPKQRDFCVSLLRRTKQKYLNSFHENSITDNRKFWKTLKPLFSNKRTTNEKIISVENPKILSINNSS